MGSSWEAYWNIGVKPGRKGQTLFKLEEMHKRCGMFGDWHEYNDRKL